MFAQFLVNRHVVHSYYRDVHRDRRRRQRFQEVVILLVLFYRKHKNGQKCGRNVERLFITTRPGGAFRPALATITGCRPGYRKGTRNPVTQIGNRVAAISARMTGRRVYGGFVYDGFCAGRLRRDIRAIAVEMSNRFLSAQRRRLLGKSA